MDMEKVVGAGLLDEFADETDFSEVMLAALRAGKSPSQIAEWPVERGQTTTAKQHFYSAMAREVERIEKLGSDEKLAYAQRWTDRAAELVDMLRSRVKHYEMEELHARTETGHQNAWSRAVAAYIANK
jgi:hypothetical protein